VEECLADRKGLQGGMGGHLWNKRETRELLGMQLAREWNLLVQRTG